MINELSVSFFCKHRCGLILGKLPQRTCACRVLPDADDAGPCTAEPSVSVRHPRSDGPRSVHLLLFRTEAAECWANVRLVPTSLLSRSQRVGANEGSRWRGRWLLACWERRPNAAPGLRAARRWRPLSGHSRLRQVAWVRGSNPARVCAIGQSACRECLHPGSGIPYRDSFGCRLNLEGIF